MEEAEKELRQGPPALSPAPRSSTVPGRALPAIPSLFRQHLLRPFARGALRTRTRSYHFAATPSGDLTSQSSFLLTPCLFSEPGSCFRGRYLEAERLQCNSLVVTSAQIRPTGERGGLGSEIAESSPPSSK